VVLEEAWMAFAWSADSKRLHGIRQSDDLKHLTFTSVDVASGVERVLGPDIMPLPVSSRPVRGLTRTSPTTARMSGCSRDLSRSRRFGTVWPPHFISRSSARLQADLPSSLTAPSVT